MAHSTSPYKYPLHFQALLRRAARADPRTPVTVAFPNGPVGRKLSAQIRAYQCALRRDGELNPKRPFDPQWIEMHQLQVSLRYSEPHEVGEHNKNPSSGLIVFKPPDLVYKEAIDLLEAGTTQGGKSLSLETLVDSMVAQDDAEIARDLDLHLTPSGKRSTLTIPPGINLQEGALGLNPKPKPKGGA